MDKRRILATSGGFVLDPRGGWAIGPLVAAAIELSKHPESPRVTYLGTAMGDRVADAAQFHNAFRGTSADASVMTLLPMPNIEDLRGHLLGQDVVYVGGGSVAGLLVLWRLHGLDAVMQEAWEDGVVMTGVSAGSICWHAGGPTDSFGPELRTVTNGLGLLPFGNAVHYDSEPERRPALHAAVAAGTLPLSYATDNGVGLLYEGTELTRVLADRGDVNAYRVERNGDATQETVLEPVRLRA